MHYFFLSHLLSFPLKHPHSVSPLILPVSLLSSPKISSVPRSYPPFQAILHLLSSFSYIFTRFSGFTVQENMVVSEAQIFFFNLLPLAAV
jgi:hypothetical protein